MYPPENLLIWPFYVAIPSPFSENFFTPLQTFATSFRALVVTLKSEVMDEFQVRRVQRKKGEGVFTYHFPVESMN
jgi:hypothetical protein